MVEAGNEGMEFALKASQKGQAALAELQFRRKGLGLSLVVIVVLGVALLIKIRTLGQEK